MRYTTEQRGTDYYIADVSFGSMICCDGRECLTYMGSVPTGYNNLEEWAENANIRAYKFSGSDLVYDSARNAELEAAWDVEWATYKPATAGEVQDEVEDKAAELEQETAQSLLDLEQNISDTYTPLNGVIGAVNSSAELVTIQPAKYKLEGKTTANGGFGIDSAGNATLNNATITGGKVDVSSYTGSSPNLRVHNSANTRYSYLTDSQIALGNNQYQGWWSSIDEGSAATLVTSKIFEQNPSNDNEANIESVVKRALNGTEEYANFSVYTKGTDTLLPAWGTTINANAITGSSNIYITDANGNETNITPYGILVNNENVMVIGNNGEEIVSVDANDIKKTGMYYLGYNCDNIPESYIRLYVNGYFNGDNGDVTQLAIGVATNNVYTRTQFHGVWNAWKLVRPQAGFVEVTTVANTPTEVTIYFSTAFSSVPSVVATASTAVPFTAVKEVSVQDVTTTSATLYIYRTTAVTTGIHWIASERWV